MQSNADKSGQLKIVLKFATVLFIRYKCLCKRRMVKFMTTAVRFATYLKIATRSQQDLIFSETRDYELCKL